MTPTESAAAQCDGHAEPEPVPMLCDLCAQVIERRRACYLVEPAVAALYGDDTRSSIGPRAAARESFVICRTCAGELGEQIDRLRDRQANHREYCTPWSCECGEEAR